MFRSLQVRLFLTFLLLVFLAILSLAFFAARRTANAFDSFRQQNSARNLQTISQLLEEEIREKGVDQAPRYLDRIVRSTNRDVILLDENGEIIESKKRPGAGGNAGIPPQPPITFQLSGNETNPTIDLLTPQNPPPNNFRPPAFIQNLGRPTPRQQLTIEAQTFRGALNQSFWLTGGAVLIAVALVSYLLSQRILRPIHQLTNAANQLQLGDLSQRVPIKGNDEISQLGVAFNEMAQGLETQTALRQNMVNDIAHELRTPLSNIRGYLEAIQDGVVTADQAAINSLHEETMLLNHLINDLQELSLAEAGQIKLNLRQLDIGELAASAVRGLKVAAAEKGISLTVEMPASLPQVNADYERIGQVLRNLIKNAITHTPAGGAISVRASKNERFVNISVADTGVGIPSQHLPHIFDRFYRADQSRNRATGNAGLGLAISQAIVQLHDSKITVESHVNEGSHFSFNLPIA